MKLTPWKRSGFAGGLAVLLAGCAQPAADDVFTVRKIDSVPGRHGDTVRIKLTTPGDYAEADERSIVRFVQIVAVREATKRQRQVAETRARAAYRKMAAEPAAHPRKARFIAVKTELSAPSQSLAKLGAPEPKAKPRAAASVMIFDTQTQEIVGNKVYDVGTEPPHETVARFETYTAEYVGSGL